MARLQPYRWQCVSIKEGVGSLGEWKRLGLVEVLASDMPRIYLPLARAGDELGYSDLIVRERWRKEGQAQTNDAVQKESGARSSSERLDLILALMRARCKYAQNVAPQEPQKSARAATTTPHGSRHLPTTKIE